MASTRGTNVRSINVSGVLGQYHHSIRFADGNDFVIVYGPNGVGKTKFLEIINALTQMKWSTLLRLPFLDASITYEDGTLLQAIRDTSTSYDGDEKIEIEFLLIHPERGPVEWTVSNADTAKFESWLRKETTWERVGPTTWEDRTDGEIAEIGELEVRYGQVSRQAINKGLTRQPNAFSLFSMEHSAYLIETQRLRIEEYLEQRNRYGRQQRPQSTIVDYSNEMLGLLSDSLAQNSRITQELDRTFPSRMLTQPKTKSSNEREIRRRYELQNQFRSRLAQLALIGLEADLSLPKRELTPFEVSMLDLYLHDADEKLQSFGELLNKINLFEQVINARLLGKTLRVNAHAGIAIHRDLDDELIDLDSLSSGEQHEIILMYGLLFKVRPGSLVMIDEPEISLHISWQLKFISDVRLISHLAGFQFIVATHSPQIINDWWAFAKQLGPDGAEL